MTIQEPTKTRRGRSGVAARARRVPGEPGIWILIFGDLTVFALLFAVYVAARADHPALFNRGSATLHQNYAVVDTLLLLTSSLLVITGLRAGRDRPVKVARRSYAAALGCAIGFGCLKVLEYHHEVTRGFTPATNDFYMYFYVLTGIHLFHLLVGMGVLVFLFVDAGRPGSPTEGRGALIEAGTCYWHTVDMLWIVLFPLLYLMK